MSKGCITDFRVKVIPSKRLIAFLHNHIDDIAEIPQNVLNLLTRSGCTIKSKIEILKNDPENQISKSQIDYKLLKEICPDNYEVHYNQSDRNITQEMEENERKSEYYLYLSDIEWLNETLVRLRKEKDLTCFLHELLEQCAIVLPENEIIDRNPVLEARCQKLREEQENRVYQKMTKNVDATLKNYPDDTLSYQLKSINSQIVAVLQFVFSVVAGFVFGFLGVQLIVGNLDFGFRLLLGIMCALVIALAEIYFLAKKLNELDDAVSSTPTSSPKIKNKVHLD